MAAIPEEWIKRYVDKLLDFAKSAGPSTLMGTAAMMRADHAMDLVRAWREQNPNSK